jgi:hypothetical protein
MSPAPRTLTVTSAAIEALAFDGRLHKEFPFLAHARLQWNVKARTVQTGCGRCGRNRIAYQANRVHLESLVKNSIATLPPDRAKVFKSLLGIDRVVVFLENGSARIRKDL